MEVSLHGFEKCGIMPFDRHKFRDHDFAIHEKLETSVDRPLVDDNENPPSISENSPTTNCSESTCNKSKPKIQILQNICIKPAAISPVPVLPGPSGVKRKNSGAAALVSGSPYKNALEEAQSSPKAVKRNLEISLNSTKPVNKLKKPGSNLVRAVAVKKSASSKKRKGRVVVSSDSSDSEEDVLYADSDEDMDPEDVECIFCLEPFSSDKAGQHWIQCCKCYKWGHEACAGAEGKKKYICDFCVDG